MPVKSDVQIKTLPYVIIYVNDTEKSLEFYRDILGIKVKSAHPGWVELETGSTTLALHGEDKHDSAVKRDPGCTIICFGVDDIHQSYKALRAAGVKVEHEPIQVCEEADSIGMSVDFVDPDGNRLSVFGKVPK